MPSLGGGEPMLLRDVARIVRTHLLDAPYQLEFPRTGRARWGHTLRVTTWALRLAVEVGEAGEVGEVGEVGEAPNPKAASNPTADQHNLPPNPRASLDRAHELLAGLMAQPVGPLDLPTGRQGGPAIDVGALATAGIIHDVDKSTSSPRMPAGSGTRRSAPTSPGSCSAAPGTCPSPSLTRSRA